MFAARNEFFDYQEPTIGAAFLTQTIALEDCTIRFELWDTAGQERYRSLAPMYYRGASAAVVVFDVTARDSFDGAKSWVKELQRRGDPSAVIALAGNKADVKEGRAVSLEVRLVACIAQHNNARKSDGSRTGTGESIIHWSRSVVACLQEAREYAKEMGIIYMDTSAKSGLNVKEMFVSIGESQLLEGSNDNNRTLHFMLCWQCCAYHMCMHF